MQVPIVLDILVALSMLIPIVAIVAETYRKTEAKRLLSDQTIAMVARGIPLTEIEAFHRRQALNEGDAGAGDPMRSMANARRTAMVLIPLSIGLFLFFIVVGVIAFYHIDRKSAWALTACSGSGLLILAIGIGFLIDYRMQQREMARFGLELGNEKV